MRISTLLFTLFLTTAMSAETRDIKAHDLIIPIAGAPHILIPAAGDANGQNGTHFRSDITIINLRSTTQRVLFYWMPQGASGLAIAPQVFDIAPESGFFSDNFVATFLSQSGLGSIEIVGVRQDNSFDPDARLHASSRIWTPRPDGAAGTMSQTFPAIVLTDDDTAGVRAIFGLRRSADFRLNVGISNPAGHPRTFRVTVFIVTNEGVSQSQFDVSVAAQSMEQRAVTGTAEGVAQFLIEETSAPPLIPDEPWHAWGSSIDNASGDAWSQMAVPSE